MKKVNVVSLGKLQVDEAPMPVPGAKQVIVRVMAAGVCGSDIPRAFVDGPHFYPIVLSHEFSGQVVSLGDGVDEHWLNQKVTVFPLRPCNKCQSCLQADYVQCESYSYYGSREDGGFSEYLAVDEFNLVPIPEHVTYSSAAMLEPAAVALHAVRKSGLSLNENVAIFGAGPIGLLVANWAKIAGAGQIVMFDVDDAKIEFCKKLGFENAFNIREQHPNECLESLNLKGMDVCIEASGSTISYENSLYCCAKGGRVVLLGNPHSDMTATQRTYDLFMRKECSMVGVFNSIYNKYPRDEWTDTVLAIADNKLFVDKLITNKVSIDGVPKLMGEMYRKEGFIVKGMMVIED